MSARAHSGTTHPVQKRVRRGKRGACGISRIGIDVGRTDPGSVVVLDVDGIPIAYLPGDSRRVRVRVIADIANFGANCHAGGQRVRSPDFQVVAPVEGQAPSSVPIRADV